MPLQLLQKIKSSLMMPVPIALAFFMSGSTTSAQSCASDTIKPVIYLQGNKLLAGITGPGSTQSPYLLPSKPGVKFTSIISVNDVVGSYRMAGIPDGLGAFDNGDGTFTLLVNHEIINTLGVVRAHGSKGAFVSKWIIRKSDLAVISGTDLMQTVHLWDTVTHSFIVHTAAFTRFCSADLAPVSAYYNSGTGLGTTERIFMDGEESGVEGRQMAHIATGPNAGNSYELPALGKFAPENSVASPASGVKTVVGEMDDGTGGQVYFYIGTKTNTGTEIEKAGLHNGKVFGVAVTGFPIERNTVTSINPPPAPGTRFSLVDLGSVVNMTGATLNANSVTAGATTFSRPEDGAWDPSHPNDFYFNTTDQLDQVDDGIGAQVGRTRLWRLRFDDVANPESGGTIEAVLDGTEKLNMLDNMAIDKFGKITLCEDVGNAPHLGKVWQYDIATDALTQIGTHDQARFGNIGVPATPPFNMDEESSGVIDASEILGPGMYLIDVQAHYAPALNTTEVVEGGQLLAFFNPYSFGPGTAADTIRVFIEEGLTTATVALGTPATADNCSVASVNNNAPATFPLGTTIVRWTVTDASGNTSTADQVVIVAIKPNAHPTVHITSPVDGSSYAAGVNVTLSADAADSDGTVVRVVFYNNGVKFSEDSTAPYLFATNDADVANYVLTAIAYDNKGDSTVSDTARVSITGCTSTGTISAEGFTGIPGTKLINLASSPNYPNKPDVKAQLNRFEYGPNFSDNYGGRVRGYICAPITGNYIFYIASDDQSELWLSTDDNPANARLIANVASRVGFRSWFTDASQKSVAIRLIKGARYYIETIHKEGTGSDHLSVGWVLPNGAFEGPIPGSRLSPWESPSAVATGGGFETAMALADQSSLEFSVTATPNPSSSDFTVSTKSKSDALLTITVIDMLGRVVERQSQVAANGSTRLGANLRPGMYFVEVSQGANKKKIKLVKQ